MCIQSVLKVMLRYMKSQSGIFFMKHFCVKQLHSVTRTHTFTFPSAHVTQHGVTQGATSTIAFCCRRNLLRHNGARYVEKEAVGLPFVYSFVCLWQNRSCFKDLEDKTEIILIPSWQTVFIGLQTWDQFPLVKLPLPREVSH